MSDYGSQVLLCVLKCLFQIDWVAFCKGRGRVSAIEEGDEEDRFGSRSMQLVRDAPNLLRILSGGTASQCYREEDQNATYSHILTAAARHLTIIDTRKEAPITKAGRFP